MEEADNERIDVGRRTVLKTMAATAAATAVGGELSGRATAAETSSRSATPAAASGPYNILFILTDQERYFRPGEFPSDYRLPAHERLAKNGIVFENHRINSCVCTPSRSVLYTGQHIQHTKMFDNTNFPWIASLSPDIRTIGHMSATRATTPRTKASGT